MPVDEVAVPTHRGRAPVELDPRVALRPGRFDSFALWVVYLMRKAFFPLMLLSATVLSLAGRDGETLDEIAVISHIAVTG